jgi:hypothetical protein
MFKFAVAALLASTTLAFEFVEAYTNELNPRNIFTLQNIFDSSYSYYFDFGYKGQYDTAQPSAEIIQDTVSFKLFSTAKVSFRFSFLKHYNFAADFNFIPLEITPLKMYLNYTNPTSIVKYQTPLTLFFKSGYSIKVADFWISWSKDMKMPKYSILDFLKYGGSFPLPTDLSGFKFAGQTLYDDPNTKVNLVKSLITDKTLTSWIGEGKYCDFDFINDEWPF